jgi:hypothetical protein
MKWPNLKVKNRKKYPFYKENFLVGSIPGDNPKKSLKKPIYPYNSCCRLTLTIQIELFHRKFFLENYH